jgi:hypothetical protein
MDKDTALRMALEALENSVDLVREDAYNAEQLYGKYPSRQARVQGLKVLADDHEKAITAIKQALAATVQEPVGRVCFEGDEVVWTDEPPESGTLLYTTPPTSPVQEPRKISDFPELQAAVRKGLADGSLIVQGASPAQEPVAWTAREMELIDGMIRVQLDHAERCDHIGNRTMAEKQKNWDMERVALLQKIRATPPAAQRQWVGLSQDEFRDFASTLDYGTGGLIRAIEAKLREKNT